MNENAIIITDPAQVAALKILYDNSHPGHLDWDFSRPDQVGLPPEICETEKNRLTSLRLPRPAFKPNSGKTNFFTHALDGGFKIILVRQGGKSKPKFTETVEEAKGRITIRVEFHECREKTKPKTEPQAFNPQNTVTDQAEVAALKDFYEANGLEMERCDDSAPGDSEFFYGKNLKVKDGHLVHLTLGDYGIHDLSPLAGLTHLTSLGLWDNKISDLRPLANLPNLRRLNLGDNKSKELIGLECLNNLRELYFSYNSITDLEPLTALNKLQELNLSFSTVGDYSALAKIKSLKKLNLTHTDDITDLSPLAPLTNLTWLDLHGHGACDLTPLSGLKRLKFLGADGGDVKDIKPLANLTALTHLNFCGDPIDGISALANLTNLESLFLEGPLIKDLKPLAGLKSLTNLYLYCHTPALDLSTLEILSGLPNLRSLSISNQKINDLSFWRALAL